MIARLDAPARSDFGAGLRAIVPLLIGVAPFGLIYGVLAAAAGLPATAVQGMSLLVFAGAAQFLAVQLLSAGAPWPILLLTTCIINLRHVLYSASLAPYLGSLRPVWKWGLAFLMVDEVYALAISRYRRSPAAAHWYVFGAGIGLWVTWQSSTFIGAIFGAQVPATWGLDFTPALTFIGLLVPGLTDRATGAAAVAAGTVAVLAAGLPLKTGLLLAALTGICAGLVAER